MKSRSLEVENAVKCAARRCWGAGAPPRQTDGNTHSALYTQAGSTGSTQRQGNLALRDVRDPSSGRGEKTKIGFRGPQAAHRHGVHDSGRQQRGETVTYSYPREEDCDEMPSRLRLLAEEDARKTNFPGDSKLNNYSAAKEVDARTLIDTIARRTRLAELYSAVARSPYESVLPCARCTPEMGRSGLRNPIDWQSSG